MGGEPQKTKEITKILIVDDNEDIRTILADIFRKRGYFVKTVGTAKEGLEEVKKTPFQFVMIDNRLPDRPGTKLLEEIKKIDFKINCIMMTAYSKEGPEISLKKGAVAHLMKPLKVEEVLKIFEHQEIKRGDKLHV